MTAFMTAMEELNAFQALWRKKVGLPPGAFLCQVTDGHFSIRAIQIAFEIWRDLMGEVHTNSYLADRDEGILMRRDDTWRPEVLPSDMPVRDLIARIYQRPCMAVAPNGHTTPFLTVEEWTKIAKWAAPLTAEQVDRLTADVLHVILGHNGPSGPIKREDDAVVLTVAAWRAMPARGGGVETARKIIATVLEIKPEDLP